MHENMPAPQERKKYGEALHNIEQAIEQGTIDACISERLREIDGTSEGKDFGTLYAHMVSGYIKPDAKIQRSPMVDPFTLDDPDMYKALFNSIADFRKNEGWKDVDLRVMMPEVVQYAISSYFGNSLGSPSVERRNQEFYLDQSAENEKPTISIAEVKGKGIAVCAEKAAMAQNLWTFAGLDSSLIMADCSGDSGKSELHAYNILKTEKGYFIYDPTNPRVVLDGENHLQSTSAAVYPISSEDFLKLQQGGEVMVQHDDRFVDGHGSMTEKPSTRIYRGPK